MIGTVVDVTTVTVVVIVVVVPVLVVPLGVTVVAPVATTVLVGKHKFFIFERFDFLRFERPFSTKHRLRIEGIPSGVSWQVRD